MIPPRLQRLAGVLVALVSLALLPSTVDAQTMCSRASVATASHDLAEGARTIGCLVNAERRRHGLTPVRASAQLRRAAARHSLAMLSSGAFDHRVRGEAVLAERVRNTGYLHRTDRWWLGEAIAYGAGMRSSPAAFVRALMNSPEHRAILLDENFHELGVGLLSGVPVATAGAGGATLTLDFGRTRQR